MKGLLLAENWPPRVGGIERYLSNLAKHLTGHSINVIAPNTGEDADEASSLFKVDRKRFFYPIIRPAWLPLYWKIKARVITEKIDFILAGKGLFEGLLAYYLKKSQGTPYIVFTYAMEIEEWIKHPGTRRHLQKVLKSADKVIYINQRTRQTLVELGVQENQLTHIAPGVEESFFNGNALVTSKFDVSDPYILTAARLVPRKGIDDLIKAFKLVAENNYIKLVIAGDGPEEAKLKQLAIDNNLNKKVLFTGRVSDSDLAGLMAGAKLFALTPKDLDGDIEGFGIVYLEAAAAGKPVVATRTGGVAEAVLDKQTGILVTPSDIPAIAQAISELISNQASAEKMAVFAKQRASRDFNWERQANLLKETINKIVK